MCEDKVEKVEEPNEEIFFVDTTPPEIHKRIVGPQYGACPPEGEDECWIADHETHIIVEAIDPEPHPVNDVYCEWSYWLDGEFYGSGYNCQGPICDISFPQETEHELHITCWDALGNEVEDVETFYVDSSPPYTEKWYEGPYKYGSGPEEWINSISTIHLDAWDFPEHQTCAVGVEETYWRNTLVDDSYCWNPETCYEAEGHGEWNLYEGPFTKDEESCHLIEYYSVDYLGHEEEVKQQGVFVDKTPPEAVKEVGEPSHNCHGLWEIITGKCEDHWDWIITMDTEIGLSCEDQGPHPSGTKEICYRWFLDGELQTDGWDCEETDHVEVQFHEESEHLLEFYCVDNVDKVSEIDSELFKVEGEEFEIPLHQKWNLISIPFNLISNNIDEVFSQMEDKEVEIEGVWSYDETGWHIYTPEGPSDLEVIEPGFGYWVKADCDVDHERDLCGHLEVGGSLLSPGPGVPPSRPLQEGWNLIGHYGTDDDEAYCSLFSLIDTTIGYPRWSALYGYNPIHDNFRDLGAWDDTYPGRGYWIEMDVEDTYSPATVCWEFDP